MADARNHEELLPTDFGWITALRAPAIRKLFDSSDLQLSRFDERDLGEISTPELYLGERLVVYRNPLLAEERKRERLVLMANTEKELGKVVVATRREQQRLKGKEKVAVRADRALRRQMVGKHFEITVTDEGLSRKRNEASIAAEIALDGIYMLHTNVAGEELSAEETVRSYKSLSRIEQAFRSYRTVDLKVRPVYHRLEGRVRAHLFLCMFAYYVEWQMRKALAPMLFDDDDPVRAARPSPVLPARRSRTARAKAAGKRTPDGLPVHSFRTLLADLATLTRNRVQPATARTVAADVLASPTPVQAEAFRLLKVQP